jgi:hypothetical protein
MSNMALILNIKALFRMEESDALEGGWRTDLHGGAGGARTWRIENR